MKNEQILEKDELIPMLLKYVKVNKVIFPIERVKYLSNEEVIEILKDCIDNQVIYNPNYEMVKNITLLDDKDLKKIYPLIKESMDYINYDYMRDIKDLVNNVKSRKKGKKYSFEEHLKALIISLLSNHRWGDNNIRENMDAILHPYVALYPEIVKQKNTANGGLLNSTSTHTNITGQDVDSVMRNYLKDIGRLRSDIQSYSDNGKYEDINKFLTDYNNDITLVNNSYHSYEKSYQ